MVLVIVAQILKGVKNQNTSTMLMLLKKNYQYTLKDSRQGVNLNTTELYELAHIICPLIKQGQSIYTILQNHKEITVL